MLAVKSICLLPYLFKAFSRYSWIHFNLGSMHTCLLLLLSLALPKEKSQSESSVRCSSAHPHLQMPYFAQRFAIPLWTVPWVSVLPSVNPWRGWVIPAILKAAIINIPGFKALVQFVPSDASCCLYLYACRGGTDTEFKSKFSNSSLGCYEFSAGNS